MYSLAMYLLKSGVIVCGSDTSENSPYRRQLLNMGVDVRREQSAEGIEGCSLLVYSHAIAENNAERLAARELGIRQISRAELLAAVADEFAERISVSGTHGKSTTTAMIYSLLRPQREPSLICGANVGDSPCVFSGQELLVYESCEYKDSFLWAQKEIGVFTSADYEHVDYYKSEQSMLDSYLTAMNACRSLCVLNIDDANLRKLSKSCSARCITYGESEDAAYRFRSGASGRFSLYRENIYLGEFKTSLPGRINISNATAALCVAIELGLDINMLQESLAAFSGIEGRLEYKGELFGSALVYDYAHHPREIREALLAVRERYGGSLNLVFKPHTYTRTQYFWEQTKEALLLADRVILLEIYPARESAIEGVSSRIMAAQMPPRVTFCNDDEAVDELRRAEIGVTVIMGAGGMENIKSDIENVN